MGLPTLFTILCLTCSFASSLPLNATALPSLGMILGPNCPPTPTFGRGTFAETVDCGAAMLELPQIPHVGRFHTSNVRQPGDTFVLPVVRTYGQCRLTVALSEKAVAAGHHYDVSSWVQIGAVAAQLGIACTFTRGDSQPLMGGHAVTGEARRIQITIDRKPKG